MHLICSFSVRDVSTNVLKELRHKLFWIQTLLLFYLTLFLSIFPAYGWLDKLINSCITLIIS